MLTGGARWLTSRGTLLTELVVTARNTFTGDTAADSSTRARGVRRRAARNLGAETGEGHALWGSVGRSGSEGLAWHGGSMGHRRAGNAVLGTGGCVGA